MSIIILHNNRPIIIKSKSSRTSGEVVDSTWDKMKSATFDFDLTLAHLYSLYDKKYIDLITSANRRTSRCDLVPRTTYPSW